MHQFNSHVSTMIGGLTVRDHFAGQAMQGMCAHPDNWGLTPERMAKMAYEIADQMLEARRYVKSD